MTTSSTGERLDLSALGRWTDPVDLAVERDHLAAYAAATDDDIPAHVAGDVAPPVFAVLAAWGTAFPLLLDVIGEALKARSLHGEQDIHYHRPIEPGMVLRTRAVLVGAAPTSRGAVTVTARAHSETPDGQPLLDQYTTLVVRDLPLSGPVGHLPPARVVDPTDVSAEPIGTRTRALAPDQTERYAAASGDHEQVHLDPEVAKASGFPGVINHGNCTFAIASRHVLAAACDDEVRRLRRLAVRFSAPVLLDERITTSVHTAGHRNGSALFAWGAVLSDGRGCLSSGYAEVASAD